MAAAWSEHESACSVGEERFYRLFRRYCTVSLFDVTHLMNTHGLFIIQKQPRDLAVKRLSREHGHAHARVRHGRILGGEVSWDYSR